MGERELSTARVLFHIVLLALTACTTWLTGAALWIITQDALSSETAEPASIITELLGPILGVVTQTAAGNLAPLANGALFTFTLLTILAAHELGHYFACRYYGIRATLPFFIPAPPMLNPFGTFGAVIKIKAPITSRRALFDIGIAGPLAGFAFAVPAAVIGLMFATAAAPRPESMRIEDPLLFVVIIKLFGLPQTIEWNPVYWAAWAALLVTSLNLFPVGQLDGGHVLYAVLGRKTHRCVSRVTCLLVAGLAIAAFWLYRSPVWFLWTMVLLILTRIGHPPVIKEEPLGRVRVILAVVAALVFLLCFLPFPVKIP